MQVYADFVEYRYLDITSFYYIKEIIFWGILYIFGYFLIPELTFIIIDYFILFLLYNSLKNMKIDPSYILVLLIFFPVILGFQNVYRSFLAISLILYAISIANKKIYFSICLSFAAILIHNTSILFAPLIFFSNSRPYKYLKVISIVGAISTSLILRYIFYKFPEIYSYSDENLNSGIDFSYLYLYLVSIIFLCFLVMSNYYKNDQFSIIEFCLYLVSIAFSASVLPSSLSERISMYCLFLLLPFIFLIISRLGNKHRVKAKALLIVLILSPVIFIPSVWQFIL